MESKLTNYLSCLPEQSRFFGCHKLGEIEISTVPKTIRSIVKNRELKELSNSYQKETLENDEFGEIGIVFQDEYLLIVRDPVIFKNGKTGTYIRVFERSALSGKTGVVILPMRNNLIYFNRIFRHATRKWELELPRGYREEGSSLEEAVEIELSQEIGLKIESIQNLGEIHPNTGLLAGSAQAYVAYLLPGEAQPNLEDGESISDTLTLTLKETNQKIIEGEIRDGFTLSTLYLAQINNLLK